MVTYLCRFPRGTHLGISKVSSMKTRKNRDLCTMCGLPAGKNQPLYDCVMDKKNNCNEKLCIECCTIPFYDPDISSPLFCVGPWCVLFRLDVIQNKYGIGWMESDPRSFIKAIPLLAKRVCKKEWMKIGVDDIEKWLFSIMKKLQGLN